MPKPRVYVETTIPSAYHTDRADPAMVARREWTRQWWEGARENCELVTSRAVLDELARGNSRQVARRLALLADLPRLASTASVVEAADTYIQRKVMPADPFGDALHLALASHHKCEVLVTWNYRHLANRTKLDHIRRINAQLGLSVPRITTPADLLGGDDE
jgi:predicted nucleic acid-binding protein